MTPAPCVPVAAAGRRVAVVLPPGHTRDIVRKTLDSRGFSSLALAPDHVGRHLGLVEVVLLDWSLLGADATATFAALRQHAPHVPFVILLDRTPFSEMRAILAAGAADVVRSPVHPDELDARLDLACARAAPAAPLPPPELAGLQHLAEALTRDLSAFVGAPLDARAGAFDADDDVIVRLPLHLFTRALEVSLFIVSSRARLTVLAQQAMGVAPAEVDDAMTDDLAREVANLAAGALKRLCAPDGSPLTMGLPRLVSAAAPPSGVFARRLGSGGADFGVVVDVHRRAPDLVSVDALREGMVVTDDLKAPGGTLLLSAGSRLSASLVQRLRGLVAPASRISVLDPEATA